MGGIHTPLSPACMAQSQRKTHTCIKHPHKCRHKHTHTQKTMVVFTLDASRFSLGESGRKRLTGSVRLQTSVVGKLQ